MSVDLIVGDASFEMGNGLLHSFCSTICYRLENNQWGSKYPAVQNCLYGGCVSWSEAINVIDELYDIYEAFKALQPHQVIWNIDDLSEETPWKDLISDQIANLSNYYVTSDGEYLFEVLISALNHAVLNEMELRICA